MLAFALLVLVPVVLIWTPIAWYGKRHGWGMSQYARVMAVGAVFVWALVALLVLRAPPPDVAKFSLIIFILGVVYAFGLIRLERFLRERRRDSENR